MSSITTSLATWLSALGFSSNTGLVVVSEQANGLKNVKFQWQFEFFVICEREVW